MIINSVVPFQAKHRILKTNDTNCIYKASGNRSSIYSKVPSQQKTGKSRACRCKGSERHRAWEMRTYSAYITVLEEVQLDPTKPKAPQLKMLCEGKTHTCTARFNKAAAMIQQGST